MKTIGVTLLSGAMALLVSLQIRAVEMFPAMSLETSGQLAGDTLIKVSDDGYARFDLTVYQDIDNPFFDDHRLLVNFPYRLQGRQHNHIMEFSANQTVRVGLETPGLIGRQLEFAPVGQRSLDSMFVRAVTPALQFCALKMAISITNGAFNNFKTGGFHEGMQWYLMLDASLRFARQTSEYFEIYVGMSPENSHVVTAVLIGSALYLLDSNVTDMEVALASARSGMYSAMMGQVFESVDKKALTPQIADHLFPSQGSQRTFESRLVSQFVRGPVSLVVLKKVPGKPPFPVRKALIKSVSEFIQFGAMVGQRVDSRATEWLINTGVAVYAGKDAEDGSMEQTFRDEFQQQLGSHTHKQLVAISRPKSANELVSNNLVTQAVYSMASEYSMALMLYKLFGALALDYGQGMSWSQTG